MMSLTVTKRTLILMDMKSLGWARNLTGITGSCSSAESFQQGVQQLRREWLCDGDKTQRSAAAGLAETKGFARKAMRRLTTTICGQQATGPERLDLSFGCSGSC